MHELLLLVFQVETDQQLQPTVSQLGGQILPFTEEQDLLDFAAQNTRKSVIVLLSSAFCSLLAGKQLIQTLKQHHPLWKFLVWASCSEIREIQNLIRSGLVDDFLWSENLEVLRLEQVLRHLQSKQLLELGQNKWKTRVELQQRLLSQVAHNIQSPMVPLEGYLEWLQQKPSEQTQKQQNKILVNMDFCLQRLRQEIDKLVFLEALAFDSAQTKLKEIVFHDFILNINRLIQSSLNHSGVQVELSYSASRDLLWADEEQFTRALNYFFEQVIAVAASHSSLQVTVANISGQRLQQRLLEPLHNHQYLFANLNNAPQHDYLELAIHLRSAEPLKTKLQNGHDVMEVLEYLLQHADSNCLERGIAVLLIMLERHRGCFYFENQAHFRGYMGIYLPLLAETTAGRI